MEDILKEILGDKQIFPVQNRAQRRQLTSFEKEKTKAQLFTHVKLLQSYLYEVINNPESDYAKSIIEGVKRK